MNRRTTGLYRVCMALMMALLMTGMKRAGADGLDFALDQNTLSGTQGSTVSFVALLSNIDPTDALSLDAGNATFNFIGSGLTLIDNFGDTPLTLDAAGGPVDSWTGVLFRVQIGAATPLADYSGSYEISYTDLNTGISTSHSQNFTVSVTADPAATPEPGTLGLGVGLATTVLVGTRSRLRRSHRARS